MKIVKDTQKQINIHPLIIYFILPPKSYKRYAARLKQLNSDEWFTKGIFSFDVILYTGEVDNAFSYDLKKAFKENNIMVRLVDDADGNNCYAFSNVDFDAFNVDIDGFFSFFFDSFISSFVDDVCEMNIRHLNECLLPYDNIFKRVQKKLLSLYNTVRYKVKPRKTTSNASGKRKKDIDEKSVDESDHDIVSEMTKMIQKAKEKFIGKGFAEPDAEKGINIVEDWICEIFDTYDKKTSNMILQGICEKNLEESSISVKIKQIVKKIQKNGKEKKEYGVEFCVDGEKFSVCFGGKESTMMYICTLLRQKMGKRMYIHEFFNNSTGIKTSHAWIKEVFEKIFPAMDTDFEDWINKIEDARGRPLNQGKTNANTMVAEAFKTHQHGVRFCTIETRNKKKDAYYMINVQSENIFVAPELEFLISDSQRFMNE